MNQRICIICGKLKKPFKKPSGRPATYCIECEPLVHSGIWKYNYKTRSFYNTQTGAVTNQVDVKGVVRQRQMTDAQIALPTPEESLDDDNPPQTLPPPVLVEYAESTIGEKWRVERYDLLVAEFPVRIDQLSIFHDLAGTNPRVFKIICRLFGMRPVIPPMEYDTEDLRVWGRVELSDALGITFAKLGEELAALKGAWMGALQRMKQARTIAKVTNLVQTSTLTEAQKSDLLKRFRFSERMFQLEGRDDSDSESERDWFCQRIEDWKKLLEQPMAEMLTRQLLLKELDLERIRSKLCTLDPTEKEYERLQDILGDKEKEYQEMWDQLNRAFPIAALIAKRAEITGVLSDVIKGIQEYKADANNATLDGLFTFLEIQVLLRQSEQVPEPQYRFGYVTAINEAMQFLWDPKWKSAIPQVIFKKLDAGFREAVMRVSNDADEQHPNIESNEGEYEPLVAVDKDLLKAAGSETEQVKPDNPESPTQTQQAQEEPSAKAEPDAGEDGEAENA